MPMLPMRAFRALVPVALLLVTGCLSTARKQGMLDQRLQEQVTTDRLRGATFEFGRHAMLQIEIVADSILQVTDDRALRAETIRWMAFAVPNIREAILRPEPIVAFLDVSALMIQYRRYFEEGDGRQRLGPYHELALETHRTLEQQAIRLAEAAFTRVEGDTIWPKLGAWVGRHPMVGANYLRESVAFAARGLVGERAEGALGAIGSMDESLRLVNERLRFLEEPLFKEVGWKAELLATDLFDTPATKQAMAPLARMPALLDSMPAFSDRLIDGGFARIGAEREAVLQEVDRQRVVTLEAISGERASVLAALALERQAVVSALHDERVGAFGDLETMRHATMTDLRLLIDHTMWRLFQMLMALGLLLVLGALAAVWLLRRSPARAG